MGNIPALLWVSGGKTQSKKAFFFHQILLWESSGLVKKVLLILSLLCKQQRGKTIPLSNFRQSRSSLCAPKLKSTKNKIALHPAENQINKTGELKVISCSYYASSSLLEWCGRDCSINWILALNYLSEFQWKPLYFFSGRKKRVFSKLFGCSLEEEKKRNKIKQKKVKEAR